MGAATKIRNPQEMISGVTFRDFAALARKKHWTAETLAQTFRGAIEGETAGSYFARVLRGESAWDCVIVYRAIVAAYLTAASELIDAGRLRTCACGCGSPVYGSHRFARETCGKKSPVGAVLSPEKSEIELAAQESMQTANNARNNVTTTGTF